MGDRTVRSDRPFALAAIGGVLAAVGTGLIVALTAGVPSVRGVVIVALSTGATALVTLLVAGIVCWSPAPARWAAVFLASVLAGLAALSIGLLLVGSKENPGASNSDYGLTLAVAAGVAASAWLGALMIVQPWRPRERATSSASLG